MNSMTLRALVDTSRKWLSTDFEAGERPIDYLQSCDFDSPRMDRINRLLDRFDHDQNH